MSRIKPWLGVACVILAIGVATVVAMGADGSGEDLSFTVAQLDKLHRVTDAPHPMADSTVMFCRIVYNDNLHEGKRTPAYCHVYVNEAAKGPMTSGVGRYPVGSVVVKSKLPSKTADKAELFTVMRKMADGYDPTHGNWEYSVLDGASLRVLSRGRIDSCSACHDQYRESDYVTRAYLPKKGGEPAAAPDRDGE